jgi:arsenical pump membrane protein
MTREHEATTQARGTGRLSWLLAAAGVVGLIVAFSVNTHDAQAAASQDWSPFVLVSGLLLIGLIADGDGLFAAAGNALARASSNGVALFLGASLIIAVVTALLNLDTSVAFLTPVLVYAARSRGSAQAPLLYGCLLLSNASSLFLPGSNLTNLIVLGHLHLTGATFLAHAWAPATAALVVTVLVVLFIERRELRVKSLDVGPTQRPVFGLGLVAVVAGALLVLLLPSPALAVAGVGLVATGLRFVSGKASPARAVEVLGAPVLVGLFGIAVALGTVGRLWSGPSVLLAHLNVWGTAVVAGVSSVVVNNLPAASMLAARPSSHPFALLVGLNLGPNLCVTGSLAWLLWLRAARLAGAAPSLTRASRFGAWVVPTSMAAAVLALLATGRG